MVYGDRVRSLDDRLRRCQYLLERVVNKPMLRRIAAVKYAEYMQELVNYDYHKATEYLDWFGNYYKGVRR